MARENFDRSLKIELVYEGGKVNNPKDPGGKTNQGVTQRVFAAWLRNQGQPARDVYTMTAAERDAIYRRQYADPIMFDQLPDGVDIVVLDGAINSGVTQSVRWLQRAVGVCADGHMGAATLSAVNDFGDNDKLVALILQQREAFLRALKTFREFGRGWMRRVENLQQIGQAWATGSVGPAPVGIADLGGHQKAMLSDAKSAPPRAVGDALAAGGTATTTITSLQSAFQPLQGSPFADRVLVILAVAAALIGVLGLTWGWYARRRKARLEEALGTLPTPANDNAAAQTDATQVDAPEPMKDAA